jgi:hypothetical protein
MTTLFCNKAPASPNCAWKNCRAPATRRVNKRDYCEPHAVRVERILSATFKPKT